MSVLKRMKNLLKLSAYEVQEKPDQESPVLVRKESSVKKKLATIIENNPMDNFEDKPQEL